MTLASHAQPVVHPLALAHRTRATATSALDERTDYAQGALALHYLDAGDRFAGQPARQVGGRPSRGGQRARADELEAWAGSFLQAVVEVVAGDRPVSQLVRWTNRRVYALVTERQRAVDESTQAGGRSGARREQVASLRVFRPAPGIAEISARVACGQRSRAVAARLDLVRGRWMCTALMFG